MCLLWGRINMGRQAPAFEAAIMSNANPSAATAQGQKRDRESTANYVASLAGDLADMARSQGLDALGYILEMAKLEAENIVRSEKR